MLPPQSGGLPITSPFRRGRLNLRTVPDMISRPATRGIAYPEMP